MKPNHEHGGSPLLPPRRRSSSEDEDGFDDTEEKANAASGKSYSDENEYAMELLSEDCDDKQEAEEMDK